MYRDDDRGQSIQIGAVLLFGALIVALAGYQAFVVPQQNEQVEFSHSQAVQDDMQDLRNALVSATGEASTRSVSVELGTRYPDRTFAVNPGPAAGSLRTAGTADSSVAVRVTNARADGETGDFWSGTTRTYSTGFVTYRPNYNRYRNAPTTVYEHSALVNDFDTGTLALADPAFVDGRTVTLVALNGSLDTTRVGAVSVDVRPVSASTRTVSVTNTSGSRVTLELPTRLSESFWQKALSDQTAPDGYVESVDVVSGSPSDTLVVELTPGENYTLRLTKAGVGTNVEGTEAAYLTDVSGNGTAVPEEGSQQVVVEVRDAFNNPVTGVTVTGSAAGGSLVDRTVTTDESGRATFQYDAPTVSEETRVALNFSYTVDPGATPTFDGEAAENVELTVNVQNTRENGSGTGSGGASYALDWESPAVSEGGTYLTDCDDDDCTWDVGKDADDTLDLTAGTGPEVEGVTLDFASNNSTVGTLSPGTAATGSNGEGSTTLTALDNGTMRVYVFGPGGASDALNLTVTNATSGGTGSQLQYVSGTATADADDKGTLAFDVENTGSTDLVVTDVRIEIPTDGGSIKTVWEPDGGAGSYQRELYFDGSDDGYLEAGDDSISSKQDAYSVGDKVSLSDQTTIGASSETTVYVADFRTQSTNTKKSVSGETMRVTFYFDSGGSTTVEFSVP